MKVKDGDVDGEMDERQAAMLKLMVNIAIPEDIVDKNNELLDWAKYAVRLAEDYCAIVVDGDN